jgi:cytochrome c-type biogenesis protein CcmH/NrfG
VARRHHRHRRARGALAVAGVALACFALWSLYTNKPLGEARDAIKSGQWQAAETSAKVAAARIGGSSALSWQLLGEAQTALGRRTAASDSLRVAVRRDPSAWEAWFDLATVASGAERRAAAAKALALNPLGPETRSLAKVVGITPTSP